MAKILGLDLGTNSIGWALIDDERKEIIKTGVRIFPEGVKDINQSKEKSKNADRRIARGIRRGNYRFKMRRNRLEKVLKELGMMPNKQGQYYTSERRKKDEVRYNHTIELYQLRKYALIKPLKPEEIGRIFLHINKHRGFKSNKKEEADKEFTNKIKDVEKINTLEQKKNSIYVLNKQIEKAQRKIEDLKKAQKKDAAKKIKTHEKRIKEIAKNLAKINNIKTLQEKINATKESNKINYGTLGEYFFHLIEQNKKSHNPNEPISKIRNSDLEEEGNYTTREIYEFEFDTIWERQKNLNKNNPIIYKIYTEENKKRIKDECIFYQRDLRSQKHLIDRCNYEYTTYFLYQFDKENLQTQIDAITYSDSKTPEISLNYVQKEKLKTQLTKKHEISVSDLKKLLSIRDDYQNENGTIQNYSKVNHLPESRTEQRDYLPCCHISALEFQEFRIWDKVNNLRYTDKDDIEYSLTPEQKSILVEKLHNTNWLNIETNNKASDEEKEEVTEVKEALGLTNEHKFKEQKIKGNITLYKLKEALGEEYWHSIGIGATEIQIQTIDKASGEIMQMKSPLQYSVKQRQLYNNVVFAANFIKSMDWLKGKGKAKKWKDSLIQIGLTDEKKLEAYSKISFEPDYCAYSLKAIKKLLPWMKQGLNAAQAVEKIGYASASDERRNEKYLQDILPEIKNNALKNPIVQKGVLETIKLINDIIKDGLGGKKPDKVHLEMARELKKPKKARLETKSKNDEREKERRQWSEFLKQKLGATPSPSTLLRFEFFIELENQKGSFEEVRNKLSINDFLTFCAEVMGEPISISGDKFNELKKHLSKKSDEEQPDEIPVAERGGEEKNKKDKTNLKLLRYRLYLECDRILPYEPERVISLSRLLADNSDIQIEHIIPYSRCMDNSFLNKTLSTTAFNNRKGKLTPMEYFESDPTSKKRFISNINRNKHFSDKKRKRFLLEGIDSLEKFKNNQLVNTAYIGTEVQKHLLNTFKRDDIVMTNGQITSMLRGFLGLNTVLNPPIKVMEDIENGAYWAVVDRDGNIEKLEKRSKANDDNKPISENKNHKVIKGWVNDTPNGKRFKPGKQREDHRHHAVDAIAIALSSLNVINIIQRNTEGYYVKDGKNIGGNFVEGAVWYSKFDENGELKSEVRKQIGNDIHDALDFRRLWEDVKIAVEYLPVSFSNKNRIISKGKKWVNKKIKIRGAETKGFYSGGDIARGALHEAFIYGKTQNLRPNEFVRRVKAKDLTWPQIRNIVDSKIKSILIKDVAKYASLKFYEDQENDQNLKSFNNSFEDLVKLEIEKTFLDEEIKKLKEKEIKSAEDITLLRNLNQQLAELKDKLKADKEVNKAKKGKKYSDYLKRGFKEAVKIGFFIENEGKRMKKLKQQKSSSIIRNPVPIKKVRVKYISKSMQEYKSSIYNEKAFVEPGNNYCIVIYGSEVLNKGETREFKTVSFLEATKKIKKNEPVYPTKYNGKDLLISLSKKNMILVYDKHPDEVNNLINKKREDYSQDDVELLFNRLFCVRKFDINGIILLDRHHLEGMKQDVSVSGLDNGDGKKIQCNPNTFKGIKVKIDRLGNIKTAS